MNINFPVEETVRKRYSVRNYSSRAVDSDTRKAIEAFTQTLNNPFAQKVHYHFLDREATQDRQKLGTYGFIKGARQYIGTTLKLAPMALEALGYEVEALVLHLTQLGIGTCWLGGTFNRQAFAEALKIGADQTFPIMISYGYAAAHKHLRDKYTRKLVQADHRKEWNEIFFVSDFKSPLSPTAAGDLAFALEMVRLGPSASNRQPWRVLLQDNVCHFYEYKTPGYSDRFPYDIQRIDIGIALAHFDLAVREKGIAGRFDTAGAPAVKLPDNMEYVCSWVREG